MAAVLYAYDFMFHVRHMEVHICLTRPAPPSGFQVFADDLGGFGSITQSLLEELRSDYSGKEVVVMSVRQPLQQQQQADVVLRCAVAGQQGEGVDVGAAATAAAAAGGCGAQVCQEGQVVSILLHHQPPQQQQQVDVALGRS